MAMEKESGGIEPIVCLIEANRRREEDVDQRAIAEVRILRVEGQVRRGDADAEVRHTEMSSWISDPYASIEQPHRVWWPTCRWGVSRTGLRCMA